MIFNNLKFCNLNFGIDVFEFEDLSKVCFICLYKILCKFYMFLVLLCVGIIYFFGFFGFSVGCDFYFCDFDFDVWRGKVDM